MARRLLLGLIWLGLWLAAGARAEDFKGVSGVIHLNPPKGYCPLTQSNANYERLRAAFVGTGKAQVKMIFLTCADAKNPPVTPTSAGYFYIIHSNPDYVPTDSNRSEWLKTLSPDKTPGQIAGAEPYQNAAHFDWTVERDTVAGQAYISFEAQGATVIEDTPVDVAVIREIRADDAMDVATALDVARKDMHSAFDRFAKDNNLFVEKAVDEKQDGANQNLAFMEYIFITGVILLIAAIVRRFWAQATLSALLAVSAVLVYQGAPGAGYLTGAPWGDMAVWAVTAVIFLGIANGVLKLLSFIRVGRAGLRERLRTALSARLWIGGAGKSDFEGDFTKRWFVTVAAATGSVVFAMLVHKSFLSELLASFGPTRIIFTLLITVVSITLIGPVEAYIFESRIAARGPARQSADDADPDDESRFEHMLELVSFRALGRFALVLAFMLMLTVAHGALEASVHQGDSKDTLTLFVAGIGPAIITYYWCASLQRGVRSVARHAGLAALLTGLLLIGVPGLMIGSLMSISWSITPPHASAGEFPPLLGAYLFGPMAIVIGCSSFGGLAFGGGLVIDFARRRRLAPLLTVAALGAAMIPMVLVYQLLWTWCRMIFKFTVGPEQLTNGASVLLAIAGWIVGLTVSGFPRVLKAGAERAPPHVARPKRPEPENRGAPAPT
ncbi:MAG: hypothetical protein ACHP7N_15040 [Caulobacterales bacterium]